MKLNIEEAAELFATCLDNESKIRVINLLLNHDEINGLMIQETLEFTQSKTSRIIGEMYRLKIIQQRKDNQKVWYSLSKRYASIFQYIFELMEGDKVLSKDLTQAEQSQTHRV